MRSLRTAYKTSTFTVSLLQTNTMTGVLWMRFIAIVTVLCTMLTTPSYANQTVGAAIKGIEIEGVTLFNSLGMVYKIPCNYNISTGHIFRIHFSPVIAQR